MMTIDDMLSQVASLIKKDEPVKCEEAPKREPVVDKKTESVKTEPVALPEKPFETEENTDVTQSVLNVKYSISLKIAKEIAYCIEKGAEQMKVNIVTAVCDGSGRLILLEAMDDSFIASIKAAQDKAYTAAALKMPTHVALKESRGGSLDGFTNGEGILMLGGGYPIFSGGSVIGSVGVSGGTKEQDMLLAQIGTEYFKKRMETL